MSAPLPRPTVVFTTDARFCMPLGVTLRSLSEHLDPTRGCQVFLITTGLGPADRERLAACAPGLELVWLECPPPRSHPPAYTDQIHFARLHIPALLPPEIDRAVYLDSDLVILSDIGRLWDQDPGTAALRAAPDRMGTVSSPWGLANWRELGLSADHPYCNTGVMVLNLVRWRTEAIADRAFRYAREHHRQLRFNEQDAINTLLAHDWAPLDPGWNRFPPYRRDRRRGHPGPAPDWGILHFITDEKPWRPGCTVPHQEIFFHYLDQTPWRGWRPPRRQSLSLWAGRWKERLRGVILERLTSRR